MLKSPWICDPFLSLLNNDASHHIAVVALSANTYFGCLYWHRGVSPFLLNVTEVHVLSKQTWFIRLKLAHGWNISPTSGINMWNLFAIILGVVVFGCHYRRGFIFISNFSGLVFSLLAQSTIMIGGGHEDFPSSWFARECLEEYWKKTLRVIELLKRTHKMESFKSRDWFCHINFFLVHSNAVDFELAFLFHDHSSTISSKPLPVFLVWELQ